MNVSMASSVSGIRVHVTRHDVTAHDVANINTPGFEQRDVSQAETRTPGVRIAGIRPEPNFHADRSNTDLAVETGEQIVNKHAVAANANVIRVKNEMLGEILDIKG